MTISLTDFIIRAGVAVLLGLFVGLDREIKQKPLGARTYMLIALGSASFMMIALNFSVGMISERGELLMDPSRIIQGIIGGIGFLGAGAVMTTDTSGKLRGTGSGAAIWGVGSVGIACGLGYLMEAVVVSVMFFLILTLCGWIEHRAKKAVENAKDSIDPNT